MRSGCAYPFATYAAYEPCSTDLFLPTHSFRPTLPLQKLVESSLLVRNKTFINRFVNNFKGECIADVKNQDVTLGGLVVSHWTQGSRV
jgi:hypothetical protein